MNRWHFITHHQSILNAKTKTNKRHENSKSNSKWQQNNLRTIFLKRRKKKHVSFKKLMAFHAIFVKHFFSVASVEKKSKINARLK